jgi:hypothetical protein
LAWEDLSESACLEEECGGLAGLDLKNSGVIGFGPGDCGGAEDREEDRERDEAGSGSSRGSGEDCMWILSRREEVGRADKEELILGEMVAGPCRPGCWKRELAGQLLFMRRRDSDWACTAEKW